MAEDRSGMKPLPILPFQQVKFVPGISTSDTSNKDINRQQPNRNDLSGAEASEFYQTVISATTSKVKVVPACNSTNRRQTANSNKEAPKSTSTVESTKLFQYAQDGDANEVSNCISNGLDINQVDRFGWTALMCAVSAGHLEIAEMLIKAGADIAMKSSQGLTALGIAEKQHISRDIKDLLNPIQQKILQMKKEPPESHCRQRSKFCKFCKMSYIESTFTHERSIAHLFNKKPKGSQKAYYHLPESNKGFQLMLKDGWDKNKGLGPRGKGHKYPVKTVLKRDRSCIGAKAKNVPRVTHFAAHDVSAVKRFTRSTAKPVVMREKTLNKRQKERYEKIHKQKEINFRRDFY